MLSLSSETHSLISLEKVRRITVGFKFGRGQNRGYAKRACNELRLLLSGSEENILRNVISLLSITYVKVGLFTAASAEVNNSWSYTSTSECLHGVVLS
jgi:hypothetical protein